MSTQNDNYQQAKDTLADVEFMTTPDDTEHQGTRALVAIGHALLAVVDAIEASRRPDYSRCHLAPRKPLRGRRVVNTQVRVAGMYLGRGLSTTPSDLKRWSAASDLDQVPNRDLIHDGPRRGPTSKSNEGEV